jgi:uncharacterized protein
VRGRLEAVSFPGPAGALEGLWKEGSPPARGSAVVGHPHPRHGGTLHNKVVFRIGRALSAAGYGTLRFNFRGVGRSSGRFDEGRGEVDDYRAALDEAEKLAGTPMIGAGFSFGAAVALKAIAGDPRVRAFVGVGVPLAAESGRDASPPRVPALFVTGEKDAFGPPAMLETFAPRSARVVVVPGADHFLDGKLPALERAVAEFLDALSSVSER